MDAFLRTKKGFSTRPQQTALLSLSLSLWRFLVPESPGLINAHVRIPYQSLVFVDTTHETRGMY